MIIFKSACKPSIMQEKTLLKLSLITSIAGISLLFFISVNADDEAQFQLLDEGDFTVVEGEIVKSGTSGNITFLEVKPTRTVKAVVFDKDYLELEEGETIELRGTVEKYKGEKELIVEEMRRI